ncbi:MAG: PilZ domain-containing protein [SAR324 cluster bacterium]|nr:PilZ domain-containing protein [SAR324 cluster bacterium]
MLTVKGKFEKGEIIISGKSPNIAEGTEVLVTLISEDEESEIAQENSATVLRTFERVKADGMISIIGLAGRKNYKLFDYSKGGLSFIAGPEFTEIGDVQAGITDPFQPDNILLELKLVIRGVNPVGDQVKVGCQFSDSFDEELWHGLQMFWG